MRLKLVGIRAFQQNTVTNLFHRMVKERIEERRKVESKRELLELMKDTCELSKIQKTMQTFFTLQHKRRIYRAWEMIKEKNNTERLALFRQRVALRNNPALAKPLLVLR